MDKKIALLEKVFNNEAGTPNSNFLDTAPPLTQKTFTWPQLNSGDDQMNAGSTLTIYSNGTAQFNCQTVCFRTSSGDTWHHFLSVYGANGQLLFTGGTFDSPRMSDGNPPPVYSWGASFAFNPELFGIADHATANYSA